MAPDPEQLLHETADGPTRNLDTAALVARANRGRRRVLAAATAGTLALLVGATAAGFAWSSPGRMPDLAIDGFHSGARAAELWDRTFVATEVHEDGVARALVEGTRLEVHFSSEEPPVPVGDGVDVANTDADGIMRWNAGCNSGVRAIRLGGGRIEPSEYGYASHVGCDPEDHDQDRVLWEFFHSRPTWALADGRLVLESSRSRIEFEVVDQGLWFPAGD